MRIITIEYMKALKKRILPRHFEETLNHQGPILYDIVDMFPVVPHNKISKKKWQKHAKRKEKNVK